MVRKNQEAVKASRKIAVVVEEDMVVLDILLEHILMDPHQPRKKFRPGPLRELADSIDNQGLQQLPVVNRAYMKDGVQYYYLKAGERRYQAHKLLGRKTIRCIVEKGEYAAVYDWRRELAQAAENSSREPHTHSEIVGLVERIVKAEIDARGQVHGSVDIALTRIAKAFGMSTAWVTNYHTLTRLHPTLRELLDHDDESKRLNFNIACALARAPLDQQLVLLFQATPLKARGGYSAVLQFITQEGRSIREKRGEKVRGRASDEKTALQRLTRTLQRQSVAFSAGRKPSAQQEYVNGILSRMGVSEVDMLLAELKQALRTFDDLQKWAEVRRNQLYEPLSVAKKRA